MRILGYVVAGAAIFFGAFFGGLWLFDASGERKSPITVVSATYGGNCKGVPAGNATKFLKAACDGRNVCEYKVDYKVLGDPAPCSKEFWAEYRCASAPAIRKILLPAEAGLGSLARLTCER